jgi:hypothetical protein
VKTALRRTLIHRTHQSILHHTGLQECCPRKCYSRPTITIWVNTRSCSAIICSIVNRRCLFQQLGVLPSTPDFVADFVRAAAPRK